jgi:hypothetical protein
MIAAEFMLLGFETSGRNHAVGSDLWRSWISWAIAVRLSVITILFYRMCVNTVKVSSVIHM